MPNLRSCACPWVAAAVFAATQLQAFDFAVRGQLFGTGAGGSGLVVELNDPGTSTSLRTVLDASGQFRFDAVRPGQYELRIVSQPGGVVHTLPVRIDHDTELNVRLPAEPASSSPAGAVSVAALRHKPERKAVREFRNAEKQIAGGQLDGAISSLEKAVAIDPLYADAYVNLAACYGGKKDYVRAEGYARRAVELDPGSPAAHANLGHMLLYLKRAAEAEQSARQALKLDGSDPSHFLLGLALKQQGKNEEAVLHFRHAASTMPAAHLHAAEILARTGRRPAAAGEIRAYLASGRPEGRPALEAWLQKLERP